MPTNRNPHADTITNLVMTAKTGRHVGARNNPRHVGRQGQKLPTSHARTRTRYNNSTFITDLVMKYPKTPTL